jgi:hypothetical protein
VGESLPKVILAGGHLSRVLNYVRKL